MFIPLMDEIIGVIITLIPYGFQGASERIPGSIDNYVTGVRECSQQRGNLKDNG
ncbi:hypothetical protein [Photorhabdus bodei]|uniref:Uncharacterized protein n=1 Tax=Photorhabdus bodei TaxID=2029681 RepID=A0AAW6BN85_9GAMM|nr:hypothetical protein [Photorhabdus bodei]MCC8463245.1 hypothetical protein [Photorhabdus bodei]MDB6373417.1 hypothetical protein [Photorhabdus bodei]